MKAKNILLVVKNLAAVAVLVSLSACVSAGAGWSADYVITAAPPPIPYYAQPPCPGPGYIWQPGYWAWGDNGYYWMSGEWTLPPQAGDLWTPGYWDFDNDSYVWVPGYWGFSVGYYGGIDYGYGYFGTGFDGGYWDGDHFFYNLAVLNVGDGFDGDTYRERPDFGEDRVHFWGRPDWHEGGWDHRRDWHGDGGGDFHDWHHRGGRGDWHTQGAPEAHGPVRNPSWPVVRRGVPRPVYRPQMRPQPAFRPQFRPAPRPAFHPQFHPQFRPQFHPQFRPAPQFHGGAPMRGGNFGGRGPMRRPPLY